MLRYIAMIEPPSGALQCCSTVRSPSVPVHAPATQASWSTAAFTAPGEAEGVCPAAGTDKMATQHNANDSGRRIMWRYATTRTAAFTVRIQARAGARGTLPPGFLR